MNGKGQVGQDNIVFICQADVFTGDQSHVTLENETIYQEDSLNITGAPELVYQGTLANNSQIILEQADFDVTTLEKTTYYLVYHYKNNGNQDNQQGLTFSGTISVRIINEKIPLATEYITSLASTSNELVYDETTDNNLRYIGTDPNNYVDIGDRYENDIYYGFTSENNTYLVYNSEEECRNASSYNLNCTKIHNAGDIILWRIIGVMNNIDDGTGTRTTRLKIIRDELYSTVKSWDINDINNWSSSSLQEEFNTDYLDSIANLSKEMIENAVWHLGGAPSNSNLTSTFYTSERGTTVYTERPITWTGKIGLMYPSDYGYATSGGSNIDRDTCLSYNLGDWNNYSDCYNNDWLYNSSYYQWTLTPHSTASDTVFYVLHDGYVYADYVHYMIGVSPALYLSSNVKIIRGTGSSSDPYVLSL